MAYESLTEFLSEAEDDGDLKRIDAAVDANLEITEITRRVCQPAAGGPVLQFENVKGHTMPVVVNLLGSYRRMCKVFGVQSFDDVTARIAGVIQPDLPDGWLESLKLVPQLTQMAKLPPKIVKTGICQQVVKMGRDVDLSELPVPHCWPGDARPTITAAHVYTRNPTTGVRNVGVFPLELRDNKSLIVHWNSQQEGSQNFAEYQRLGHQMPVAVALGGDPIYRYMASAPVPTGTDACLLGGFLRGSNIELVKCRSIELEVPSDAEIVIEGMIDPSADLDQGGPIGQSTGHYSLPEPLPVLNVSALTHRSNPYFPVSIPCETSSESFWFGKANEYIFLPFVRLVVPEVVDLYLPPSGQFRNSLFVKIDKQYPQQARKVMHALWSLAGLMVCKMIVVVDADVDVHDEQQGWFAVGAHAHPGRDVVFCEGPADPSDHAAPVRGMGHKMGIDATRKLPEEGHPRPWPDALQMNADIKEQVTQRWSEYGFADFAEQVSATNR